MHGWCSHHWWVIYHNISALCMAGGAITCDSGWHICLPHTTSVYVTLYCTALRHARMHRHTHLKYLYPSLVLFLIMQCCSRGISWLLPHPSSLILQSGDILLFQDRQSDLVTCFCPDASRDHSIALIIPAWNHDVFHSMLYTIVLPCFVSGPVCTIGRLLQLLANLNQPCTHQLLVMIRCLSECLFSPSCCMPSFSLLNICVFDGCVLGVSCRRWLITFLLVLFSCGCSRTSADVSLLGVSWIPG